jgi:pilus assembly protein CpaB
MTRSRRAAALGGLSLVLGALAASDVAGREAALDARLGPPVEVVVARTAIAAGARIGRAALAVRLVPARYAPRAVFAAPAEVAGARAGVAIPAGADLGPAVLETGRPGPAGALVGAPQGERIARIVAVGAAAELPAGSRTDILVTRDVPDGRALTHVAMRDVEVVGATPATAIPEGSGAGLPRVALALRVTVRQAVYLAQAQSDARELRALPRPR